MPPRLVRQPGFCSGDFSRDTAHIFCPLLQ